MTNSIKAALIAAAMAAPSAINLQAEEPIITFHTRYYELQAEANIFTIYLGSSESTYVDIDGGFGSYEEEILPAVFDYENSTITATPITCTVDDKGIVNIYGDASKIDYIDFSGSYITSISFPTLTNIEIINLEHNELTGLDLSHMTKLMAAYLSDNPGSEKSPIILGPAKPNLTILEANMIDWLDPNFDLTQYPAMKSLSIYGTPTLTKVDSSKCPGLLQMSIDGASVESVDVTANPNLLILNVSETKVTSLDLSKNPYLTELYIQHEGQLNQSYKFKSLDISHNPELQRLYLNGNEISELDLTTAPKLVSFGCRRNKIKALNFDKCPNMTLVDISLNDMTFTTMPLPRETFTEYNHNQNPIALDRSYAEGHTFDLTDQVMLAGSVTDAVLYSFNKKDPSNPVILDDEYFTFDNGKFTVNKAYEDSVYVAFKNTLFPDIVLTTSNFMVKTADKFGKPTASIVLPTSMLANEQSFYVGFDGATPENPVKFLVSFGNNTTYEFTATTSDIPSEPNVSGMRQGTKTTIYAPEGCDITAFKIADCRLSLAVTFENAPMLRKLVINGCNLPGIDLKWNRCLSYVDLSNNALTSADLSCDDIAYTKTMLTHVFVDNNKLTDLTFSDQYGLQVISAANNKLTALPLNNGTSLTDVDLSNNLIESVDLEDCEALVNLNLAGNKLSEINIPVYVPLQSLNIANNNLSIPALPLTSICDNYTYAPQGDISIPTMAPSINLSSQYIEIDGNATQYQWKYASDNSNVAAANIAARGEGRFGFANPNTGEIYCAMTHPAFPQFEGNNTLKTTVVKTAERPDKSFASFKTAEDATAQLSLAATQNGTTIYIDWTGEGDFDQYILGTEYTLFEAQTKAGTEVKCYSYDTDDKISVFSLSNVKIDNLDVSQMKSIFCLGVSGCHINTDNIKFPVAAKLTEFLANNCDLTELNLNLPDLYLLSVSDNLLISLDLTKLPKLGVCHASNNQIEHVALNNPDMWELALVNNQLSTIDLAGAPAVSQLWLSRNKLESIDVAPLKELKVLTLDSNNLTFNTLPKPSASYFVYEYKNQAPVEIEPVGAVVDLSAFKAVGEEETAYTWYIDTPYYDENGDLVGEDLYIDEEYTLEGGVTTFLKSFKNIMCVMVNPVFPSLNLYTNFIDVTVQAGIDEITVDNDSVATYYNLQGQRIDNPSAGLYIVKRGNKTTKELIK